MEGGIQVDRRFPRPGVRGRFGGDLGSPLRIRFRRRRRRGGRSPPPSAMWLDALQIRELEPLLHHDVVGGWWFPEDASVDARRLTCSLRAACVGAGVDLWTGKGCEVKSLELGGELNRALSLSLRHCSRPSPKMSSYI